MSTRVQQDKAIMTTQTTDKSVETIVADYRNHALNRREFMARLIGATGSMALAHLMLERSGLAATLVSDSESREISVQSQMIECATTGQKPLTASLSVPDRAGSFPAVVVIHENRGLNEHTRDVARRFASEGFVALAPDLLSRVGGTASMPSPDDARAAIMALPSEDAIADLKSCLSYLDGHNRVNKGQLGSVGFCWGGLRSFLLATEDARLRAAVVFYGSTPPLEKLADIHCPVLGLYGATDERITSRVPETIQAMKAANKPFEHKIYEGAGHAFFNDAGPNFNAAAADDAWNMTLAFLRLNLSKGEPV